MGFLLLIEITNFKSLWFHIELDRLIDCWIALALTHEKQRLLKTSPEIPFFSDGSRVGNANLDPEFMNVPSYDNDLRLGSKHSQTEE